MPFLPAPQDPPLPLERARVRLEFDDLVRRRAVNLAGAGHEDDAQLVDAIAGAFADAVDRSNAGRQVTREPLVEYVDAVVLTGAAGELVIDAPTYDEAPVSWHARAGVIEDGTVIRGRDLDGYLRTGEARYAEQLGLPA